jgi:hypothetical protein
MGELGRAKSLRTTSLLAIFSTSWRVSTGSCPVTSTSAAASRPSTTPSCCQYCTSAWDLCLPQPTGSSETSEYEEGKEWGEEEEEGRRLASAEGGGRREEAGEEEEEEGRRIASGDTPENPTVACKMGGA